MPRVLRCADCAKRIKPHHPHIGLIDYATGAEVSYHARCQERAAAESAAHLERGKFYVLRMTTAQRALTNDRASGASVVRWRWRTDA